MNRQCRRHKQHHLLPILYPSKRRILDRPTPPKIVNAQGHPKIPKKRMG